MSGIDTLTGGFLSDPDPTKWRSIARDERELAAVMGQSSLVLWPRVGLYATRPAGDSVGGLQYGELTEFGTISRATEAYDLGWSGRAGDEVGLLRVAAPGALRDTGDGLPSTDGGSNVVFNPRGEGSPPTTWSVSGPVVFEGVGVHRNGCPYARYSVADLVGTAVIYFDSISALPAVQGDPLAFGLNVALAAGSMENLDINLGFREGNNTQQTDNNELTGGLFDNMIAAGGIRRIWHPFTIGHVDTTFASPRIILRGSGAGATATIDVGLPHVARQGYLPPLTLPPVGQPGASNSEGDNIFIPSGDWMGGSAHSLMLATRLFAAKPNLFQYGATLHSGTTQNIITLGLSSANARRFFVQAGGADNAVYNAAATAGAGDLIRMAAGVSSGTWSFASDGDDQVRTGVIASNPTFGAGAGLQVGGYVGTSTARLDSNIQEIRYAPVRLTDAELDEFAQRPLGLLEAS